MEKEILVRTQVLEQETQVLEQETQVLEQEKEKLEEFEGSKIN